MWHTDQNDTASHCDYCYYSLWPARPPLAVVVAVRTVGQTRLQQECFFREGCGTAGDCMVGAGAVVGGVAEWIQLQLGFEDCSCGENCSEKQSWRWQRREGAQPYDGLGGGGGDGGRGPGPTRETSLSCAAVAAAAAVAYY